VIPLTIIVHTEPLRRLPPAHRNPLDFLYSVPEERHIVLDEPALGLVDVASDKRDQGKRSTAVFSVNDRSKVLGRRTWLSANMQVSFQAPVAQNSMPTLLQGTTPALVQRLYHPRPHAEPQTWCERVTQPDAVA
jgi:hypothetical protein